MNTISKSNTNFNTPAKTAYTCSEIRQSFIQYFKDRGHEHVPSSSLVPINDKTLLFVNAGMVQFKDVFLGKEKRTSKRAVTCQKCMRAGGKHNDLENVGYTKRHHTFFEMLGNFSFGDYFKREAITYAWEYLTKVLKIAPEKLWITVHHKDDEAAKIWLEEIKIKPERFSKCGDKDNFWSMGETGPCGFCSEIYYDYGSQLAGDPPGDNAQEGERYVEIWNLVFMEFERDENKNLTKLPNPSIDTGMGLERIAAVMQQEVTSGDNYEIDTFRKLGIDVIGRSFGLNTNEVRDESGKLNTALRVIMDHTRAIIFLLTDGVFPSNEGRGYVLRQIIRRAMRYVRVLRKNGDLEKVLLSWGGYVVDGAIEIMQQDYPELIDKKELIKKYLKDEIVKFDITLENGTKCFEQEVAKLTAGNKVIPGQIVFTLYDTYGFPFDLTVEMAKERGLFVDLDGFQLAMAKQRAASRAASKFAVAGLKLDLALNSETKFIGYEQNECASEVMALFKIDGTSVNGLTVGDEGIVVLKSSPFYAESGGQIGDSGEIFSHEAFFSVEDTKKYGTVHLHYGRMTQGTLHQNLQVRAVVNTERRQKIKLNHSAAHLLHKALHLVLGEHALQRGSAVDDERLRFDFTHFTAVNALEIKEIERIVNREIRNNLLVITEEKSLAQAKAEGVTALFDQKYGNTVRVVKMGDFSAELCGGTHVARTGDLGVFKIILETSVAAGVRRIEALTGETALSWFDELEMSYDEIANVLKVEYQQIIPKIQQLIANQAFLDKELVRVKAEKIVSESLDLTRQAISVNNIKILVAELSNIDAKNLRQTLDQLKSQLGTAVILLASVSKEDNKIQLVVGVTADCVNKIKANEIIQFVAPKLNGSGGGRADMAQGGGTNLDVLPTVLAEVKEWIKEKIL